MYLYGPEEYVFDCVWERSVCDCVGGGVCV